MLQNYQSNEFGLLANLLVSEGKPGMVLKVSASARTGEENFVTAMRKIVGAHYGDKAVGFGGVFLIEKGKVVKSSTSPVSPRCTCLSPDPLTPSVPVASLCIAMPV